MLKPLKKPAQKLKPAAKTKRPTDPNRAAHAMMADHMVRVDTEPGPSPAAPLDFEAAYKAHMRKLGQKGGKTSGARRTSNLSAEERSAIALKAAIARWKDKP